MTGTDFCRKFTDLFFQTRIECIIFLDTESDAVIDPNFWTFNISSLLSTTTITTATTATATITTNTIVATTNTALATTNTIVGTTASGASTTTAGSSGNTGSQSSDSATMVSSQVFQCHICTATKFYVIY